MSGSLADQPVIDTRALFAPERASLLELLGSLTTQDLQRPTVCEGWSVHDVALHLLWGDISNISRRRDGFFGRAEDNPANLDDLQALIEFVNQLNEDWVRGARRMSPALLLTLLRVTGDEWSTFVQTIDIKAMGDAVGWAGPEPAPAWLDIAREFTERWVHQQHIRDAVNIPGATDPLFLKPVLGAFAIALPYALRTVDAEVGAVALLNVTGESGGVWMARKTASGWGFTDTDSGETAGSVTLDQDTAWRLFTRGIPVAEAQQKTTTSGNSEIVQAILNMVTILA